MRSLSTWVPFGFSKHFAPRSFVMLAVWAGCAVPVQAQQTRTEVLAEQQAAKARASRPYEPGRIEKALVRVENNQLIDRWTYGDGFFPWIGGITTGGGLAFGGGYRRQVINRHGLFEASAATSIKGYDQVRVDFGVTLLDGRLELSGDATYRSFPQEDFYGLGLSSVKSQRVNYSAEGFDFAAMAVLRPRPWLSAGTRLGYLDVNIGRGTDTAFPSIEQQFTPVTAPGLDAQPNFLYQELFADVDTRDEPGNPRRGGHYRVDWVHYGDRDLRRYTFSRFSMEGSQFFPIFDKKRVFLARARLTATDPDSRSIVPFFLKPTLGGSHTLRSVNDFRFRDDHLLLFNVEYRWEAFSGLDMAVFADAGKVTSRRDLDLDGLKKAYGIGFRFNTHQGVFFRVDLAHGEEGFHFFFKFSGPFKDREHWPTDTRAHRHKRAR